MFGSGGRGTRRLPKKVSRCRSWSLAWAKAEEPATDRLPLSGCAKESRPTIAERGWTRNAALLRLLRNSLSLLPWQLHIVNLLLTLDCSALLFDLALKVEVDRAILLRCQSLKLSQVLLLLLQSLDDLLLLLVLTLGSPLALHCLISSRASASGSSSGISLTLCARAGLHARPSEG